MKSLFSIILFFLALGGSAQHEGDEVYTEEEVYLEDEDYQVSRVQLIDLNFSIYNPIDAFAEKISKNILYGFSFAYLRQIQLERPAFLGIEIFHMNLGLVNRRYEIFVGGEQLEVAGKVASNALGFNLIYRHYPKLKFLRIEPYVEGHLGGKWLYAYLSEGGVFLNEETYNNFDFIDGNVVLTYGGALGFQIHISDRYYLNLKANYHFAVSGKYQKPKKLGSMPITFPQEGFETTQSSTNTLKFDIGLTTLF